jgi:hypothetical protein
MLDLSVYFDSKLVLCLHIHTVLLVSEFHFTWMLCYIETL